MKIDLATGFFILSHDSRPIHDFNDYFRRRCIG